MAAERLISGRIVSKKDIQTYYGISSTTFRRRCRSHQICGDRSHFLSFDEWKRWQKLFGPVRKVEPEEPDPYELE